MKRSGYLRALGGLVVVYCVYYGLISFMKYRSYAYNDFDLAVHALSMRSLCRASLFNSILGIPFLGNHMQPILFLLAPVYMIFGHPLTLLLLQTLTLGCAAFPLYAFTRRLLDERWALVVSAAYLLYPALGYVNLYEFHPVSFAVLFVLMALMYYESASLRRYLVCMFLAMFCKENIPFLFIALGVYAFWGKKDKRWAGITVVCAGVYAAVALSAMHVLNRDTVQYLLLYEHLGSTVPEIARNLMAHPSLVLRSAARPEVLAYIINLLGPLVFLPLIAWMRLFPAAPFFLQHILSGRRSDLMITYHYTAAIIPIIFWALAYGIKRILSVSRDPRFSALLQGLVFSGALLSSAVIGPALRLTPFFLKSYVVDAEDRFKEHCVRLIPSDSSVVATFEFLAHLCDRDRLYSLHHDCKGTYTLSRKPYQLPPDVSYALIDFNDRLTFSGFCSGRGFMNLQRFLLERPWEVIDYADSIVLLRQGGEEGFPLVKAIARGEQLPVMRDQGVVVDGSLRLLGDVCSEASVESGKVEFTLYWECLSPTPRDIAIVFHLVDGRGRIGLEKSLPLGYRVFPVYSWKRGERYLQRFRLTIPREYRSGEYALHISFWDTFLSESISVAGSGNDKSFCLRRSI